MELTTSQIIKIIIGVLVIVSVVIGIYFSMKYYILPYFSGITYDEPKIDPNSDFGKELLQEKNLIGRVDITSKYQYFIYKKDNSFVRTEIYFYKRKIYFNIEKWFDRQIGFLDNNDKISINRDIELGGGLTEKAYDVLNNAYKNYNEIYKIK